MLGVELRVDIGGSDNIPHSFLVLTDANGKEHGYGLVPLEQGQLTGNGWISDDTDHEYNTSTGKIPLSVEDYNKLVDYIQNSIDYPPPYYLPFGSQCADWAVKGLVEAGIPAVASPNLMPDNIFVDLAETII
jgi:hypothetical protein